MSCGAVAVNQYTGKDGQTVIVREADKTDGKTIEDIINSVASEKYLVVPDQSRKDWDVTIEEIKKRNSLIIVAQVDEQVVGMAHLVKGRLPKNKHVGFLGISILKDFRGNGIGNAMMNYTIEWAKRQNELEKISLTVFSTNNPAINLYRKLGFTIEGRMKKHYKIEGKYIDDIAMTKLL